MDNTRYQKLNNAKGSGLVCKDCPVKVSDVAILFDTENRKRILQMTFSNYGDKAISGVFVKVICYDRYGNRIPYGGKSCRLWSFSTLSLPAFVDDKEIFGGVTKLVNLDSDDIVDCDIFITKVFFKNGSSISFKEDDYISSFRQKQDEKKRMLNEKSFDESNKGKRTKKLITLSVLSIVLVYTAASLGTFFFKRIVIPGRIENQINSYVESCDFDAALLFAKENNRDDLHNMIVGKASEYYFEIKDYENAIKYALLSYDHNIKTTTYIRVVQSLSDEGRFDEAIELSLQSEIESLADDTERLAVEYYRKAGDYLTANSFIPKDHRNRYSDFYTEAAEKLLESGDEVTALHFGLLSGKTGDYSKLYDKIITGLIEKEDFGSAALLIAEGNRFTTSTVTEQTVATVFDSLDEGFIRSNFCTVFPQLSFERKISISANAVDVRTDVVLLTEAGKVESGKEIFTWSNVASIRTSGNHTVCVKKDGAVAAKGDNTYLQCDVSSLRNIIEVGAGEFHTVALNNNGTVTAIGLNNYGQCNVGGFTDIIAVAAGRNHTVLLRSDGTVAAVGDNSLGQCDVSEFKDVIAISAGDNFTVALMSNGKLVATGDNSHGQCSVSGAEDVFKIAAGDCMTVCLLKDGTVSVFGGTECNFNLSKFKNVSAIAAGKQNIVALTKDGTLIATGTGAPDISDFNNLNK